MEISLEKIDSVVERTYVSYKEAKEALEFTQGNVLEAIIHIENKEKTKKEDEKNESLEEFKVWLKNIIKKGNVTRVKIKKEDELIIDLPVNAGIAVAVISVCIPALLAFGVIATVATKVTIEITFEDGRIEVVNKYIYDTAKDIKEKAISIKDEMKIKFNSSKEKGKETVHKEEENIYSYKVNFDDEETENDDKKDI